MAGLTSSNLHAVDFLGKPEAGLTRAFESVITLTEFVSRAHML
jgi:hypothetical protein